ncbi:MAG: hypothetical protein GY941_24550 [Planctomycetes bacterium]|nr:hypothetical protein [Planctomycetota bacterium]
MFSGLIKSTFGIVGDVATIVAVPVKLAVDGTRIVTKPVAEVAKEVGDSLDSQDDAPMDR